MNPITRRCSFCGRIILFPIMVIMGPSINKHKAYICEDCVAVCAMMVVAKREGIKRVRL